MNVDKARKILKEEAKNLSDEQIKKLLEELYLLAEIGANFLQNKKEVSDYDNQVSKPLLG